MNTLFRFRSRIWVVRKLKNDISCGKVVCKRVRCKRIGLLRGYGRILYAQPFLRKSHDWNPNSQRWNQVLIPKKKVHGLLYVWTSHTTAWGLPSAIRSVDITNDVKVLSTTWRLPTQRTCFWISTRAWNYISLLQFILHQLILVFNSVLSLNRDLWFYNGMKNH